MSKIVPRRGAGAERVEQQTNTPWKSAFREKQLPHRGFVSGENTFPMGKFSYIVTRAIRFTEGAAQGNGNLWGDQLRAPALARFMFMIFSRMDLMEDAASPEPEP